MGASDLCIHHVAQSRCFRVLWFCHEASPLHQVIHHSSFDKSLRSPVVSGLKANGPEKSLLAAPRAGRGQRVCARSLRYEDDALVDWLSALMAFQAAPAVDGSAQIYTKPFYEAPDD